MMRLRIERTTKEGCDAKRSFRKVEKSSRKKKDPRITRSRFSWKEFLVMWFAIMVIGTGAVLILLEFQPDIHFELTATLSTLSYLAFMAFLLVFASILWRQLVYERPIRLLGEAAREVAQGNFGVRLSRLHKSEKKDYIDVMFEDFNAMVEELNSIETLKDDFVGNVSHEIKTPLATIENYASVLSKKNLDAEERLEYSEAISDAAKRLSILVSNILRLNKLENQEIVPESEPYDLTEQLRDCVLAFEAAWEEKDIAIEVNIDDECIINKDRTLLEPVWSNLLSNAIKFTDAGGTIKVSQRADAANIRVDIIDTGIGMDEATQHRIFDKFYQGDTSHAQEGNGLGLALAARALKLVDGEMDLSSTPGEGSTFTVWLRNSK